MQTQLAVPQAAVGEEERGAVKEAPGIPDDEERSRQVRIRRLKQSSIPSWQRAVAVKILRLLVQRRKEIAVADNQSRKDDLRKKALKEIKSAFRAYNKLVERKFEELGVLEAPEEFLLPAWDDGELD